MARPEIDKTPTLINLTSEIKTFEIAWQKCERGILRRVDFAIGPSVVELLEYFDYVSGRMYRVRDVETGHEDLVGFEFLKAV